MQKNGKTVQKNVQQTTQLCYQQQQHNNTYTFVTVVQFKMHSLLSLSLPISNCHCMLLADSSRNLHIDDMLGVTVLAHWEKLSVIINCRASDVQLYSQSSQNSSQRGVLKNAPFQLDSCKVQMCSCGGGGRNQAIDCLSLSLSWLFSLGIAVSCSLRSSWQSLRVSGGGNITRVLCYCVLK